MSNTNNPQFQQFQTANSYQQTSGQIPLQELMGIAKLKVGGETSPFLQAGSKLTQNIFIDNVYNKWFFSKGLRTREVSGTGSYQYVFKPAALPVSNYAQTDAGNRSFATEFQVYGQHILFLQTNFWSNEFVSLTKSDFISGIQEMLLGSYSKSIAMVKAMLGFQEAAMFSLASGQFFLTDWLGKTTDDDVGDPNNVDVGNITILWSTQQPVKSAELTTLVNRTPIRKELNMLSTFMMKYDLAYNMFAIGYDLDKIHIDCSPYMRKNLAQVLNLGWPTETNMNMLNKKSYIGPELSRWFNITLTDTGTQPLLQNRIPLVAPEVAPNASGGGSPLGYGVNNVNDFGYLKHLVAYISMDGSVETYTTPYVPFNPYTNSKTFYRLGGTWGWGQVHLPILSATNYALIDSRAYITINSITTAATQDANHDWQAALQSNTGTTTNPTYTATMIFNGIQYTCTYTLNIQQLLDDMTQAQAIEMLWEPGMGYDIYNFPTLPTTINGPMSDANSPFKNTMSFATWAQYRSLTGLNKSFLTNDGTKVPLIDLLNIGNNQGTFGPFAFNFSFPQDTPVAP